MENKNLEKVSKIQFIRLNEPKGCRLWGRHNIKRDDLDFEPVEYYENTSHFSRSLLKCRGCGQLYYSEFYEEIDWEHGDDRMYSTYIPVEYDAQFISYLNKKSPLALLAVTPRLQWDNDKPISWIK